MGVGCCEASTSTTTMPEIPLPVPTATRKTTRRTRKPKLELADGEPAPKRKRVYKTKAMRLAEAEAAAQTLKQEPGVIPGVGWKSSSAVPASVKQETEGGGLNVKVEQGAIAGTSVPAAKGKKRAVDTHVEQRMARDRKSCPKAIMDRASRVMSQRMFLVDRHKPTDIPGTIEQFMVLGSTGNVYTINIGQNPRCNCPDCLKGNIPCKHIVFVLLKVLKVPAASTVWYQKSLLASELEQIFLNAPPTPAGSVAVSTHIRSAYRKAAGLPDVENIGETSDSNAELDIVVEKEIKGKRNVIGDDCPVCYSEMTADEESKGLLVYDESLQGCGNALHKECFTMWSATVARKGDQLTCVWCRAPWAAAEANKPIANPIPGLQGVERTPLGYVNMAGLAGLARERDTSTYYHGPVTGMRMWQAKEIHKFRYDQGD